MYPPIAIDAIALKSERITLHHDKPAFVHIQQAIPRYLVPGRSKNNPDNAVLAPMT